MIPDYNDYAMQITLTEDSVRKLSRLISPEAEILDDGVRLTEIIKILGKAPEL
jgi:hypothetical protein